MFPDFNIYSAPLLILVIQGLILSGLLFHKAVKEKNQSTLLLGILLLITCYHRTTYTIGFMGWYDTFRNTKINYFLISLALAVGPLIYFYIKSCVQKNFRLRKKDIWHFIPVIVYVLISVGIYLYDRAQPGFTDTSNGVLVLALDRYYWTLVSIISAGQMMLYLAFSFQLYYRYRSALIHHFSNTYQYELHWLRNFLYLYGFLFVYSTIQSFTDGFIFDLHWTEEWWFHFFSILVVIYLGVKGYFTDLEGLPDFTDAALVPEVLKATNLNFKGQEDFLAQLQKVKDLMEEEQLFLDPNLNLNMLSRKSKFNPSILSKVINVGAGMNFNDFVNAYRVEYVKEKLKQEDNAHLSILAIALDAGFNSKATFNRVFKNFTGQSPSSFRK